MFSLFKPFGHLIDPVEDKTVEKFQGKVYNSAIGAIGWIFICLLASMVFIGLTWWRGSVFKPVEYLSVQGGGSPQPLDTLVGPVYSSSRIQSWVSNVVAETLTFNFRDIEQQVQRASTFYTDDAAVAMRASIESNRIITDVKEKRLVVTVTPLFTPRITEFLIINGVNTWVVEAPILLTYTSASDTKTQPLRVVVRVRQVNPAMTPDGLLVSGFVTTGYAF